MSDFLRSCSPQLLRRYFEQAIGPFSQRIVWAAPAKTLVPVLQRVIEELDREAGDRILHDADRIGAMADVPGDAALYATSQDHFGLDALPNGYSRALWMFLGARDDFEHAEQVRYADDRRYGRIWEGYLCNPGMSVPLTGVAVIDFETAISGQLGSRHAKVEVCHRSRARFDADDAELVQATIYREGRSGERKTFVNGQLNRVPDRPVIEAAITYEKATGVIEVVAADRENRENLVRLFADHMLGVPFEGKRLSIRQYSLDRLRTRFLFPTDPEDNIEGVAVRSLRLMPLDTSGERVTLECMRGAQRDIWAMAEERFREHDPLGGGYVITHARFTIRFRAVQGARGGRTLPVTITMPKGCDLKDRTERERLVGEKYLRRWGLLRDV